MTATLTTELTTPIGKTSFVNFDDVDPTTAREIRHSVENFYRDFPTVAPGLRTVILDGASFTESPYAYAVTQPVDLTSPAPPYRITVNPHFYGPHTRAKLLRDAREDYLRGFHGYEHPVGTFEHELGHVLDMFVGYRRGAPAGASLQLFQDGYWGARDGSTVSEYALEGGPMEAFADAFANVRTGYGFTQNDTVNRLVASIAKAAAQ